MRSSVRLVAQMHCIAQCPLRLVLALAEPAMIAWQLLD